MNYALIGDYEFEFKKHQLDELSQSIEFGYSKIERIGNFPTYHAINKHSETYELRATIVLQKQAVLDEFIATCKEKKPLLFITGYGKILGNVLVQNISIVSKDFIRDGKAIKRDLNISLTRFYDE